MPQIGSNLNVEALAHKQQQPNNLHTDTTGYLATKVLIDKATQVCEIETQLDLATLDLVYFGDSTWKLPMRDGRTLLKPIKSALELSQDARNFI